MRLEEPRLLARWEAPVAAKCGGFYGTAKSKKRLGGTKPYGYPWDSMGYTAILGHDGNGGIAGWELVKFKIRPKN